MKIQKVTDTSFRKYGRVIGEYDFTRLGVDAMEHTPVSDEVVYEPSVESLEKLEIAKLLQEKYYGELPIQVGFCNGKNYKLNALEYHRSSEVNVAATDAILILGSQQDIADDCLSLSHSIYSCVNISFGTPHRGHLKSSGSSSHFVPGAIP